MNSNYNNGIATMTVLATVASACFTNVPAEDQSGVFACNSNTDCLSGYVCDGKLCQASDGVNVSTSAVITAGPSEGSYTADPSANFSFTCDSADCTFECTMADRTSTCTSPFDTGALQDGAQVFSVRAVINGIPETTEATRQWIVDTVPPEITIEFTPDAAKSRLVLTNGGCSDDNACTVSCSSLGADLGNCGNNTKLLFFSGENTVIVTATDSAGNTTEKEFLVSVASTWTTLSSAYGVSCALDSSGVAWCWGNTENPVVGSIDGKIDYVLSPSGRPWQSITLGGLDNTMENGFACGLDTEGAAFCWGASIINGSNVSPQNPLRVDTSTVELWSSISAGYQHACAIAKSTGKLYCWGWGGNGELGQGTTKSANIPTQVENDTWRQVSAGAAFTCGITNESALKCWGTQSAYFADKVQDVTLPLTITQVSGAWQQVAVGKQHTCATALDGSDIENQIYCWGFNKERNLGVVSSAPVIQDPTLISVPWKVGSILSIDAYSDNTCIRFKDADTSGVKVGCWGVNSFNRLNDVRELNATLFSGEGNGKTLVAPGAEHNCMADASTITCTGRLGSTLLSSPTPKRLMTNVDKPAMVDYVALGAQFGCAGLRGGNIACWGYNNEKLFNTLNNYAQWLFSTFSNTVAGSTSIAASDSMAENSRAAVLAENGDILRWGRWDDFSTAIVTPAVFARPTGVTSWSNTAKIELGSQHSCILDNGNIYCSGPEGFLLSAAQNRLTAIAPVNDQSGSTISWKDLALGARHACAIAMDSNELYCWGDNSAGQLGQETAQEIVQSPVRLSAAWTVVAAAGNTTCAVSDNKAVYCWGSSARGQAGKALATVPTPETISFPQDPNIQSLAMGENNVCAINNSGQLYCWGDNRQEQLGPMATGEFSTTAQEIPLPNGATAWKMVKVGQDFICALARFSTTNAEFYCWGANDKGQLGRGDAWIEPPLQITMP